MSGLAPACHDALIVFDLSDRFHDQMGRLIRSRRTLLGAWR